MSPPPIAPRDSSPLASRGPARFAAWTLGVNVLVVLWGAVVRATGSGAGCGSHWPLCNGVVVPRSATVATLIEYTHRLTSGAAYLMCIALVVWCWRALPRRHPARGGAVASLVLVTVEAAVGAALVLFHLVGRNASGARAVYMGVHLGITFFLLAALALTTWWAAGGAAPRLRERPLAHLALAATGLLLVGATGAIAALGDTLFPAGSLAAGMRQDLDSSAHLLVRLRFLHPLLAAAIAGYLLLLPQLVKVAKLGRTPRKLGSILALLALAQVALGAVNLSLLAPVWLQILHLLLADALWVALVIFAAAVLGDPRPALVAAAARAEARERALPRASG